MAKIDIEQIRADREAGTQGPWHVVEDWHGEDVQGYNINNPCVEIVGCEGLLGCKGIDARRIARVPELEDALIEADEKSRHEYHVGPLTFAKVFQASQLVNMHDMQAVLDAVERALSE